MAHITGRKWIGSGAPPEIGLVHQLIGQIASNWSDVEGYWYLILTCLMKETPRKQVDAIFFMFDSGASQRAFVMAMADVVYPKDQYGHYHPNRRKLGQLNATTCDLAGLRNAAVHGRVIEAFEDGTMQKMTPRMLQGETKRENKLVGQNDLAGELKKIGDQVEALILELVAFLDSISPKRVLPKALIEALDKLALQPPNQAAPHPNPPTGSEPL